GQRYHVITSNPPYIATRELASLQEEVRREPAMALDGGADGLDFYRKIPLAAAPLLERDGLLVMEIGESQGEAVSALVSAAGFRSVTVCKDFAGNDRMVTAVL
ncbi:MAG: hypothetical protein RRY54_04240, partial [Angelakisella sp.]